MNKKQKILYLVRHAKSSWDDASLHDRERPLNKRGRRSAIDMGKQLAEQGHKPGIIVASPAKRAYSTAKKIAKQLGSEAPHVIKDDRLYFSGLINMLGVVEELDDRFDKAMIVGHNPAMTNLLNALCDTSVINMPTCAIAVIGFDIESWADLDSTDGELLGYDYPKGPGNFAVSL